MHLPNKILQLQPEFPGSPSGAQAAVEPQRQKFFLLLLLLLPTQLRHLPDLDHHFFTLLSGVALNEKAINAELAPSVALEEQQSLWQQEPSPLRHWVSTCHAGDAH